MHAPIGTFEIAEKIKEKKTLLGNGVVQSYFYILVSVQNEELFVAYLGKYIVQQKSYPYTTVGSEQQFLAENMSGDIGFHQEVLCVQADFGTLDHAQACRQCITAGLQREEA
jgi:hypothetical protein